MKYNILLSALFFISCVESQNFFNGDFMYTPRSNEIIKLHAEDVKLDIYGVFFLHIIDSFLLAENEIGDDHFITIYDINDLTSHGRYINKGRANHEYQMLVTSKDYIVDSTGAKIWINVGPKRELILFNISKSISENRTVIDKEIKINNPRYKGICSMSYINDSLILGLNCGAADRQLITYNYLRDSALFSFNLYNDKSLDLSLFAGETRVKPDGTKWVNFLESFDQLNFYSFANNEAKSVSTSKRPIDFNEIKNKEWADRKLYYSDIWCNNNLIIATYSYNSDDHQCNELHFFNWEGDLLQIFSVDRKFVEITVDCNNNEIYLNNLQEEIFKVSIGEYFDI